MTRIEGVSKLAVVSRRFLFSSLLLCLAGCSGHRLPGLPQQVLGEWRTAEARYQGRSMRLETDRITFGMGGAGPDKLERVEAVRVSNVGNGEEYRINLREPDGSPDLLTLNFKQQNGGEIRLKSQPQIVWRTGKAASLAAASAPHDPQTPDLMVPLPGMEHKTIYKIDCLRRHVCKSY